jgi:mannosyltransferase OCH1-like enzyme
MFDHCHQKWAELNPNYTIIWYNGKQRERFIIKHYPPQVIHAYKMLKPGAYKADLWRICILYKFGGVYIDSYATSFCSLDEMFKGCLNAGRHQFISALDPKRCKGGIHNGFIVSSKGHPFLLQCIKDIISNVSSRFYGESPMDVTGPVCLRRAVNKVIDSRFEESRIAERSKPLHHGKHSYGEMSFYLFEFQWGPRQYICKNGTPIISKKYSVLSYFYEKNLKKSYAKLWEQKNVFN